MGNIHDENKGHTIICHTNKAYWWMFIGKKKGKLSYEKKCGCKIPEES